VPHDGKYIVDSWECAGVRCGGPRAPRASLAPGVIGLETRQRLAPLGQRKSSCSKALEQFFADGSTRPIAKGKRSGTSRSRVWISNLGAKSCERGGVSGNAVDVVYADSQGEHSLQVDKLVVAVGPPGRFTEGLFGRWARGVRLDERGFITVR